MIKLFATSPDRWVHRGYLEPDLGNGSTFLEMQWSLNIASGKVFLKLNSHLV